MPHMMPMMWIILYISILFLLMITICLVYFFYLPSSISKPLHLTYYKWTWMW